MSRATISVSRLFILLQSIGQRLLTIGENRIELLAVEVQEERKSLLRAFLLALIVACFGMLTGVTFTATLVILFWTVSPWAILLGMSIVYASIALLLFFRLSAVLNEWQALPSTLDQLHKDRVHLESMLS
jgi:uncharacterized membrane protein YqjE